MRKERLDHPKAECSKIKDERTMSHLNSPSIMAYAVCTKVPIFLENSISGRWREPGFSQRSKCVDKPQ
jgi:hypothetical protein